MSIVAITTLLASAFVAGGAPPCEEVTFYSSLDQWTAATSDAELKVTFNEGVWPVNQHLYGTWTVNGISFVGLAGTPQPNIYVANFGSPFGTGNWLVANGDENIDITPQTPVHAIACNAGSNGFGPAYIKVYGTQGQLLASLTIATGTSRFVGITSGVAIGKINFSSTLGAVVDTGVDSVRIATYAIAVLGDLDDDDHVSGSDLAILLGAWAGSGVADLDCNGNVDGADLGILLGNWTG